MLSEAVREDLAEVVHVPAVRVAHQACAVGAAGAVEADEGEQAVLK